MASSGAFNKILAAASGIVTIAGPILTWSFLSASVEKIFAAAASVALLVAIWRAWTLAKSRRLAWGYVWDVVPLALALACISVIVTLHVGRAQPSTVGAPSPPGASTVPSLPAEQKLRFVQPPPRPVPRCNVYQGVGQIPDEKDLLIFSREVDSRGGSTGGKYYLEGVASRTRDGWTTPRVDEGGTYAEVSAVLVTKELSTFLRSIVVTDERSAWIASVPLPGSRVEPPIVIELDPKTAPCGP